MNRELLQRAIDSLIGARDSVSNELGGYIEHPSNARIIASLQDDLAKVDASISELRAALAVGDSVSPGEPVAVVDSWANGSYWRNYKLTWLRDVPEGTKLYTHAIPPDVQRDAPAISGDDAEAIREFLDTGRDLEHSIARDWNLGTRIMRVLEAVATPKVTP